MSAVLPEHSEPPTIAAERECGATPLRAGGAVDAEELAALRAENAALKSRLRELEQQQRTEPFVPGVLPADAVLGRAGVDGGLKNTAAAPYGGSRSGLALDDLFRRRAPTDRPGWRLRAAGLVRSLALAGSPVSIRRMQHR